MKPRIHVGLMVAYSPAADTNALHAFAERLMEDVREEISDATGAIWEFHIEDPTQLENDNARRPSDFLDEASLRMAEGPFDIVVVITDVSLASRRRNVVAGLVSPVGRMAVISTRKLLVTPRGKPVRTLESEAVRWNVASLLLHLMGHILGVGHARDRGDVMAPYAFDEDLDTLRRYGERTREKLQRTSRRIPDTTLTCGNAIQMIGFHLLSVMRHPGHTLLPVIRNRAPLLPLALPGLATAAVAPMFILVFTAEIWDVGLNMPDRVAGLYALVSILAATWYLTSVQNLFFPRNEKRVVTEHIAIVNSAILLTMLLAMIGLFVMVGLLTIWIEIYVFPPRLIQEWPTLEDPEVTLWDKIRLAIFISTVGVTTGALAGGLESRTVIRHLALFLDEP
ncbi:MAG: hypothetical protein KY468_12610 [Armatimonadetes bacterium]|nr:hypothetical protein [Armatimonadota bacterium]